MEFSIATMLANFTNDKLVAAKVLEKKLDCQDEICLRKLQIALDVLEKIGVLVKERGKYRRIHEEGGIEAKLRCSSKGFCFAIQDVEGAEDIYIRESYLNTAWNGDRVLVKMTKEGSRRRSPEGEVRLILERSHHSLLSRIKQANNGFRAVPLDDRLLFEIELQPNGNNLAEAIDHLVHVEIMRYPLGQLPPIGRVVKILGSDAETAADVDLVCCKHDLPRIFPASVLEAAAGLSTNLSKGDLKQRLDLRSLLTIAFKTEESAVFPPTPVIENALTLEKIEDARWRLGIHIADVAHYVTPDSPLDREAMKRGSCVYLGETVLPLLPEAVAELCSLLPGSDRLAISILLTLDAATGQLVEFEIQPTVIQVDRQLNEQQAQAILSAPSQEIHSDELESSPPAVVELLKQLSALSAAVKEQRLSRGSFELQLPPTQYSYYDETPLGVIVVDNPSVRSLLTELMLLANQVVASHLLALSVPAIYQVQPAPDPEDVQETIRLASNLMVELRLNEEDVVQPCDFKGFTEQIAQSPDYERVLTYLVQATLKNPVFSTTPQPHFGLALEQGYTHCHAPLRRYGDLLIQQICHAVFTEGRDRRTTRAKESVNLRHSSSHGKITWNVLPPEVQQELEINLARALVGLNDRTKEVQDAEADLVGLQKAQLMKQRTGEVFQGLITGVQSYGFFVEIEVPDANGRLLRVEGLVHVSSLRDDWYEYRSRQQALFGRKNRASYRLGDRVNAKVKSVDYYRQQIDLVTVNEHDTEDNALRSDRQMTSDDDLDLDSATDIELNEEQEPESYFDEE